MKLIYADVYLESLRKYEDKLGTKELEAILGHWFGDVAKSVLLQALDNYVEGLEEPVYKLEVDVHSGAIESLKKKGLRIPRRHGFLKRLRYLMFG